MERKHNRKLTAAAKELRKSMTKGERRLWYNFLRQYPIRFTRQKVLGRYVADFYCASAKLVIELDGSQHYEPVGQAKDAERTAFLAGYDLTVIRIPNNEIRDNFYGVCEYIDGAVKRMLRDKKASPVQGEVPSGSEAEGLLPVVDDFRSGNNPPVSG